MKDRRILYFTTFLRAFATGVLGVLLGLYLARLNLSVATLGIVLSMGLLGAVGAALLVTMMGDRLGRRRVLVGLALLNAAGTGGLALVSGAGALVALAFFGMVNGMGRDRGAALIVEQAILPATANDTERTRVYAWYNVVQDFGHALGGLAAAAPTLMRMAFHIEELDSLRVMVLICSALSLVAGMAYLRLSANVEVIEPPHWPQISPASRRILTRISQLFALDSVAGGFLGSALLAYFFFERFGVSEAAVATLFFVARLANALSHLGAAWLATRIGLVKTMVFTHIPSSLVLATVPFAPDFLTAAALFLVRESLVEMDVPTRQSYVMAMVQPEERTFASGVTHLVRLAGWAVGPVMAGAAMTGLTLAAPLVVGATLKVSYDLLLWQAFRHLSPREEK
ncbi:ABC transporter permease [Gammaproteobacteria bacterium]